jgi:hypothetical protein
MIAAVLGPSPEEKRQIAREKRWATGADGEELLALSLARHCPDVPVLHDRRMPRSCANIDHLAFARSGVYVIDAKRYRGRIKVVKPLFGAHKLVIAGRDQTRLLDGLAKQVAAVQAALGDLAHDVPVHGCLCFMNPKGLLVESGLPTLRTLEINGYPLYHPRALARRLSDRGPLAAETARRLQAELARRFPPAATD